jgi:hypothetical protein
MAAQSAKNATVKIGGVVVVEVLEWNWNRSQQNPDYRSNSTAGETSRVAGHKDSSGSFRVAVALATSIWTVMQPGDTVASLELFEDAVKNHSGPALIDSMEPTADINGDGLLEVVVNFSQTGAWTEIAT